MNARNFFAELKRCNVSENRANELAGKDKPKAARSAGLADRRAANALDFNSG